LFSSFTGWSEVRWTVLQVWWMIGGTTNMWINAAEIFMNRGSVFVFFFCYSLQWRHYYRTDAISSSFSEDHFLFSWSQYKETSTFFCCRLADYNLFLCDFCYYECFWLCIYFLRWPLQNNREFESTSDVFITLQ
jgi:hypothetical protein